MSYPLMLVVNRKFFRNVSVCIRAKQPISTFQAINLCKSVMGPRLEPRIEIIPLRPSQFSSDET